MYTPYDTTQILLNVVEKFKKKYPSFLGAKVIYTAGRQTDVEHFKNRMKDFLSLK